MPLAIRGFVSFVSFDRLYEWEWRGPGNLTSRGAQYFLHDFTIIDGRALEAAVVEVGQFDVIQTQQMQNRGMDVVDVGAALDGAKTDLVGSSDGLAALHSAARHPDRKAPRIVISPFALLVERSAAKLTAPDHERRFQQAARFEIRQQPGDRPV